MKLEYIGLKFSKSDTKIAIDTIKTIAEALNIEAGVISHNDDDEWILNILKKDGNAQSVKFEVQI